MLVSAELRWFWRGGVPAAVDAWFWKREIPAGGGNVRTDEYLVDRSQIELGLKKRGTKPGIEIKGLVGRREAVPGPESPLQRRAADRDYVVTPTRRDG